MFKFNHIYIGAVFSGVMMFSPLAVQAKVFGHNPSLPTANPALNITNNTAVTPSGATSVTSPVVVQQAPSPVFGQDVYDTRYPKNLKPGPVCVIHQPYGDIVRTDNFCVKARVD